MTDYAVQVKVQNNRLLRHMELNGVKNAWALAKLSGVGATQIGEFLNLKTEATRANGEWRSWVVKIATALRCLPEDIVPPAQRTGRLKTNRATLQVDAPQAQQLLINYTTPHHTLECEDACNTVSAVLKNLTDRERQVVYRRFGFMGRTPLTQTETAADLQLSQGRVRQLELKALEKLRHTEAPALREALSAFSG